MLPAVIIGASRSGSGVFLMRSRTLCWRSRRRLRLRSLAFLRLRFRAFSEIVAVTRKPPKSGTVRKCSYLNYSINSGAFEHFLIISVEPKKYHACFRTNRSYAVVDACLSILAGIGVA